MTVHAKAYQNAAGMLSDYGRLDKMFHLSKGFNRANEAAKFRIKAANNPIGAYILNRCKEAGVAYQQLISKKRPKQLSIFRQQIMFELQQSGHSYPAIGRMLRRHHTNILRGVRAHKARIGAQA